ILKLPVIGPLAEKNTLARTMRTLGTLVSSGVPILEGLNITKETATNAMFERIYGKVIEAVREGETINKPLKQYSKPGFHPVAAFWWFMVGFGPFIPVMALPGMLEIGLICGGALGVLGILFYLLRMNARVIDDLVVNMVDVGEETGELDKMLYKV